MFFPKEQNVLDQYNLAKNVLDQFFSPQTRDKSPRERRDISFTNVYALLLLFFDDDDDVFIVSKEDKEEQRYHRYEHRQKKKFFFFFVFKLVFYQYMFYCFIRSVKYSLVVLYGCIKGIP